jgi:hypothetical protein
VFLEIPVMSKMSDMMPGLSRDPTHGESITVLELLAGALGVHPCELIRLKQRGKATTDDLSIDNTLRESRSIAFTAGVRCRTWRMSDPGICVFLDVARSTPQR